MERKTKHIIPKVEPLDEFWSTYYSDQEFMWLIGLAIGLAMGFEFKAEINHYNLN